MNNQKSQLCSLSKYLAQAGIASRRKAVDLIRSGIVMVNGVVISEPGHKLNPKDTVEVSGAPVKSEQKVYILLNKPKNCITTVSDDRNRYNVIDHLQGAIKERIYPIGRLDRNTTGLLVLTNDGELALKLAHPRFEVEKIYNVRLDRPFTRKDMNTLLDGIQLEDGFIKVDAAHFFHDTSKNNLAVALHSGKYRVVRRLFEALDYEVTKLDRVCYAGLTKTGLSVGAWRHLTHAEVAGLKNI